MESGTIASWKIKEGDSYRAGDVLCEVETDKATVSFEAQDDGILAKILVSGGKEIKVGEPIMVTVDNLKDVPAFQSFVPGGSAPTASKSDVAETVAPSSPPPSSSASTNISTTAPAPASSAPSSGGRVIASPLAWTLAKDKGINLTSMPISGSGPGGRIIAADVKEFVPPMVHQVSDLSTTPITTATPVSSKISPTATISKPTSVPAQTTAGIGGYTDYPLSESAQLMAAQLTASKQTVPHYYLTVDICLDKLVELRSTLNKALGNNSSGSLGTKSSITLNDLLIKAAAVSMKSCPTANASWLGHAVRVYDSVDVNLVMGNGDSLYAPVIRNVGGKGLVSISDEIASALVQIQEKTVSSEAFSAVGTVTIMNLGMYGIKSCAPIIRQPQAVALALGAAENRIVPNDDDKEGAEIYKTSVMLTATLSCDHRVVDGAVGAQWLSAFKAAIENPATLLL